jgi:hypothetical protein
LEKILSGNKKKHQGKFTTINTNIMTRHKLIKLKKNVVGADENGLSSKAKQSVVTTLKLFASQNCKPDL